MKQWRVWWESEAVEGVVGEWRVWWENGGCVNLPFLILKVRYTAKGNRGLDYIVGGGYSNEFMCGRDDRSGGRMKQWMCIHAQGWETWLGDRKN